MTLPADFGSQYIVKGAENNPDTAAERARIIGAFILSHNVLVQMGYKPETSALVNAYQGLSDKIRNHLDKGEKLPSLRDGKFAPARTYQDSVMSFLADARSFTFESDERANRLTAEVYTLWQTHPLPAYLLVQYAQSFENEP